jgi:hypothetical protein
MPPSHKTIIPPQAQTSTIALTTAAQMSPLSPQNLRPGVEGEVGVDHAAWRMLDVRGSREPRKERDREDVGLTN